MSYCADVTEPDPNLNIISKYLSELGPSGPVGSRRARVGYPSSCCACVVGVFHSFIFKYRQTHAGTSISVLVIEDALSKQKE